MNINLEVLSVAGAVGRDKGLSSGEEVILMLEQAMEAIGKEKYGHEHELKASINRKTGEVMMYRVLKVVDTVTDSHKEIELGQAQKRDASAVLGAEFHELLPPVELSRGSAQIAKKIILQKMQDLEKAREYAEFEGKIGKVVSGIIKRMEYRDFIVDLGKSEGILRYSDSIRGENLKVGDRIKVYIKDINSKFTPQIQLSRTDDNMLSRLFAIEVPEIAEGIVEVKATARIPGVRSKIAVFSRDRSIDAAGCCIGHKALRINSVSQELNGEKIDIVLWDGDLTQFITNAINPHSSKASGPIKPLRIITHEEQQKIEVIVAEDHIGKALGSKGQNVKLASKLVGWKLEVITDAEESERRLKDLKAATEILIQVLQLEAEEELIAELLVVHGFSKAEHIAEADEADLANIEGFDLDTARELKNRAQEYILKTEQQIANKLDTLGISQELIDLLEIDIKEIITLAEDGITTLADLADLDYEQFMQILPNTELTSEQIEEYLLAARNSLIK